MPGPTDQTYRDDPHYRKYIRTVPDVGLAGIFAQRHIFDVMQAFSTCQWLRFSAASRAASLTSAGRLVMP
jgi:hypothetical protein